MIPTPAWVEIDLDAIEHNLDLVRRRLAPDTDVCVVLAADAYGHGIEHVLPLVMKHDFDTIGIEGNEDALAARFHGFTGRIIRIRPALAEEIDEAIVHEVEEWVSGAEHAETVARVAQRRGIRIPVHLSIDATRSGFDGIDLLRPRGRAALRRVMDLEALEIVGICSHTPLADHDEIVRGACAFRVQSAAVLRELAPGSRPVQRHCATSFASLRVPDARFDLVRIGAAVYGDTAADPGLRRAFALKSRVAALNEYRITGTGADRSDLLDRDARLAVVPVGCAPGMAPAVGEGGSVLIRGRRLPIVDRQSMHGLVVDVSPLDGVRPGEEVVLVGRQGEERITSADFEHSSGRSAAELSSVWGRLHPRIPVRAAAAVRADGV